MPEMFPKLEDGETGKPPRVLRKCSRRVPLAGGEGYNPISITDTIG